MRHGFDDDSEEKVEEKKKMEKEKKVPGFLRWEENRDKTFWSSGRCKKMGLFSWNLSPSFVTASLVWDITKLPRLNFSVKICPPKTGQNWTRLDSNGYRWITVVDLHFWRFCFLALSNASVASRQRQRRALNKVIQQSVTNHDICWYKSKCIMIYQHLHCHNQSCIMSIFFYTDHYCPTKFTPRKSA